ncbi:hypothetical protein H0N95_02300 [Candidatus Micrarchaeota archaeon]|nr:hypothetical protein [Candidatus Micrarchaeota archaeon]
MIDKSRVRRAFTQKRGLNAVKEEAAEDVRSVFEGIRKTGKFSPITTERVVKAFEMRGFPLRTAREMAVKFEMDYSDLMLSSGEYVRMRENKAREGLKVDLAELAKGPALRELGKLRVDLNYVQDDARRASNSFEFWKYDLLKEQDDLARLRKYKDNPAIVGLKSKAEARRKIKEKQDEVNATIRSLPRLKKSPRKPARS